MVFVLRSLRSFIPLHKIIFPDVWKKGSRIAVAFADNEVGKQTALFGSGPSEGGASDQYRAKEPVSRVRKTARGIDCSPTILFLFHQCLHIVHNVCVCVCVSVWLRRDFMNYRCYQVTLQWNTFTQIGAVRSVDWIFIVGAPVWRWLGQNVTLDRAFYIFPLNRKQ